MVIGPIGFLAFDAEGPRFIEVDGLVEGEERGLGAVTDLLLEKGVDLEGGGQVAPLEVEIQRLAVAVDELIHLFGGEIHFRRVEALAVSLEHAVHVHR